MDIHHVSGVGDVQAVVPAGQYEGESFVQEAEGARAGRLLQGVPPVLVLVQLQVLIALQKGVAAIAENPLTAIIAAV